MFLHMKNKTELLAILTAVTLARDTLATSREEVIHVTAAWASARAVAATAKSARNVARTLARAAHWNSHYLDALIEAGRAQKALRLALANAKSVRTELATVATVADADGVAASAYSHATTIPASAIK